MSSGKFLPRLWWGGCAAKWAFGSTSSAAQQKLCSVPAVLSAPGQPKLLPPDCKTPFSLGFFFSHPQSYERRRAHLIRQANSKQRMTKKHRVRDMREEGAVVRGRGSGLGQHPARSAPSAALLCILHRVFVLERSPFAFLTRMVLTIHLHRSPPFPFPFLFYFKFR